MVQQSLELIKLIHCDSRPGITLEEDDMGVTGKEQEGPRGVIGKSITLIFIYQN